jgi:hypothetical protein
MRTWPFWRIVANANDTNPNRAGKNFIMAIQRERSVKTGVKERTSNEENKEYLSYSQEYCQETILDSIMALVRFELLNFHSLRIWCGFLTAGRSGMWLLRKGSGGQSRSAPKFPTCTPQDTQYIHRLRLARR